MGRTTQSRGQACTRQWSQAFTAVLVHYVAIVRPERLAVLTVVAARVALSDGATHVLTRTLMLDYRMAALLWLLL